MFSLIDALQALESAVVRAFQKCCAMFGTLQPMPQRAVGVVVACVLSGCLTLRGGCTDSSERGVMLLMYLIWIGNYSDWLMVAEHSGYLSNLLLSIFSACRPLPCFT